VEVPRADTPSADGSLPIALVVEDDGQAASLMNTQLKSAGFSVRHAISGEEALAMVPDFIPDLITLDIALPGMDGWEFLSRIKALPTWANVPVVVVSVVGDHEIGLSLGASAILPKPFGPNELMQELHRLGFSPDRAGELTVAVVDDDPRAVELMCVYLQQTGYRILKAYGGQEGIDMIQREKPDLIVLDLLMPDLGGIEVIEVLKRHADTAQIPIIMVTAKQFSDHDRSQLNSHVLSVVSKSDLHQNRFLSEVRRACRHPLPESPPVAVS
jgi:CheY-like chemotaxis protein